MNPNNPNRKNAELFQCNPCDFTTSKESNYNTHLSTRKHQILINPNRKNAELFLCKTCDFTTSKESNYNTHLSTRKHQILINPNNILPTKIYTCNCGKTYKHLSTLCSHKKNCTNIKLIINEPIINEPIINEPIINEPNNKDIINLLIKENSEMKNIVLDIVKSNFDLQKQLIEVCKNTSIINCNSNSNNHNNNKTFNLQFFLNEQCKDAMNISDFANSIDLQLSDLESVGELGYVEGITKIMIDKLNSMDIYKRPIHCSDAKRETLYVKDDNKWEKEGKNNPKLRYVIKTISFRNMKLAALWSDTYPESQDGESHLNDTYLKIIKESTGGRGEISVNEDKIIRRIAKEIIIDK